MRVEARYRIIKIDELKDKNGDIVKMPVDVYPQSFNTYDSLGEAYMLNGDKELAIKSYKKSLELNPNNTNAVETLKKLNKEIEQ